jgi:hypothetical protein
MRSFQECVAVANGFVAFCEGCGRAGLRVVNETTKKDSPKWSIVCAVSIACVARKSGVKCFRVQEVCRFCWECSF